MARLTIPPTKTCKSFIPNATKEYNWRIPLYYGESTEDSSVRLQYVDEARFLRAYYYYLLVQHFGGVALNTTMFESAVMNHARESAETFISSL